MIARTIARFRQGRWLGQTTATNEKSKPTPPADQSQGTGSDPSPKMYDPLPANAAGAPPPVSSQGRTPGQQSRLGGYDMTARAELAAEGTVHRQPPNVSRTPQRIPLFPDRSSPPVPHAQPDYPHRSHVVSRSFRPVVQLDVAVPPHAQVRTVGLGRFFPAGTVHNAQIHRSGGAVTANNCHLTQMDHYHIHRATVSVSPLLQMSQAAKDALNKVARNPDDMASVRTFQRQLEPFRTPEAPGRLSNRASRKVAAEYHTTTQECTAVQQGDYSNMNISNKYVLEETVLPLVDLLAEHAKVVQSFARTLGQPGRADYQAKFQRSVLDAAGCVEDLELLSNASDLQATPDASLSTFFGTAKVDRASAVMIGTGNQLDMQSKVDRPSFSRSDLLADLDKLGEALSLPQYTRKLDKPDHSTGTPSLDNVDGANISHPRNPGIGF